MSDLGSELAGQTIRIATDLSQALLRLISDAFKTIYDQSIGKSAQERKSSKYIRDDYKYQKLQRELSSKSGHIDYNKLKNAGVPLAFTGLDGVTKEQYTNIKEACIKHDLLCSALTNSDGSYIVMCKRSDHDLFLKVVNNEISQQKIKAIDKAIAEIEADFKNGKITEAEKEEKIKNLTNQRDEVVYENNNALNNEEWSKGAESILNDDKNLGCSRAFNKAILWNTDNFGNVRNEPFYIVDALDPEKFIECTSYKYEDIKGKEKVGTDYVVHGSKSGQLLNMSDKNYNAIPPKEWFSNHLYPTLDKMKAHANFSNCVFKLQSKEEFDKFKSLYSEARAKQSEFDFDALQPDIAAKYLEVQLVSNGYSLSENGYVINSKTQERISVLEDGDFDKFTVSKDNYKDVEALIIGKQINAYQTHHLALKNADNLKGNDTAYNALIAELNEAEKRYKAERVFVASKKAEFESRNNSDANTVKNVADKSNEKTLFTKKDIMNDLDKKQTIDNLLNEIKSKTNPIPSVTQTKETER